jgi:crotonobetainyl-CoA:carnitine CoA-transferase CaiB-like acyl-CoA transferase
LDLSDSYAGPYCTKLLADFGADVVKVERPHSGDPSRHVGPFRDDLPNPEASGTFLYLNTNKRSITLNFETRSGRELLARLLSETDVVVESHAPGKLAEWGLAYDDLQRYNPRIVLTSITPFGQESPWRDWKAEDLNLTASSGLMSITGDPEREPLKIAGHQAYYNAGISAFGGTMMAVHAQEVLGIGQHVDVSIADTMTFMIDAPRVSAYSLGRDPRGRAGRTANRGSLYPAKDGHIIFNTGPSRPFETLVEMTGDERFLDERFQSPEGRAQYADDIQALLTPWLLEHGKEEFYHFGQARGQLHGYVASPEDLLRSEQLLERGFFVEVDHPIAGTLTYPGAPYKLSQTPWRSGRAPLLGEHNEEVYCGRLGLSREELTLLRRTGVI